MGHIHDVYDTDKHFSIDPITRVVKNETVQKTILIQGDHNSERFAFDLPRYVDGHDMTLCDDIKLHYNNIDAVTRDENKGVYDVRDLEVNKDDPEKVVFSWLISENATKLVGTLNFLICFACTVESVAKYRWNTAINSEMSISKGMNNTDAVVDTITENYPDILAQWESEIFGNAENAVSNINLAEQTALKKVQTEGTTQVEAVRTEGETQVENVRAVAQAIEASREQIYLNDMQKACAIVGEAQGEVISLTDSAEMPFVGLNVFGKSTQETTKGYQLLDFSKITMDSGGTTIAEVLEDGKRIKVTGTKSYAMAIIQTDVSAYVGKTIYLFGTIKDGNNPAFTIRKIFADGTKEYIRFDAISVDGYVIEENVSTIEVQLICNNTAVTLDTATTATFENTLLTLDKDGTWEKYTGGTAAPSPNYPQAIHTMESIEVGLCGANLIDAKSLQVSTNTSLEVSEDGYTIKATGGTASGWCSSIYELPAELVKMLRGKKIFTKCDSFVSEQTVGARAGFNVTLADGTTVYPASVGLSNMAVTETINKNAVRVIFGIYANNSGEVLETDNTITIKGLRVSILDYIDWKPYKTFQSMFLPYTLHGIPVATGGNYTDADGQEWICDEVDLGRGVLVQKTELKKFILSKSVYEFSPLGYRYQHYAGVGFTLGNKCLCKNMQYNEKVGTDEETTDGVRINKDAGYIIAQYTDELGTTETIELEILYILPEPIETPLTEEEIEAYKALCTNYPNTTILNDCGAWIAAKYGIDTKTYIDRKFEELKALITQE